MDSFQVFYSKTIKRRTKVPVWQMGSTFVIINLVAHFLALVTTMVTKVDHGNYGWLPRLVTMVSYLGYQGANYGY